VRGERFCSHHFKLLPDVGEEALRSGAYVRRRRQDSALVRVASESSEPNDSKTSPTLARNGNGSVSPNEVRPRLAALVGENLSALEQVLLDTALGADRATWVTTTCKSCNRGSRHEVLIPDHRVRLDAAVKLLEQGLGRVGEAPEVMAPRLPATVDDAEAMSWAELQAVAAFLASEFEGEVREQVAALSREQRRLLRRALDGLPAA
jgi:hypothetical protein